jgi:hypothetical protein
MDKHDPEVFHLDVIGGNGTPFRFEYTPAEELVRYRDRRYTLTVGAPGYGINHTTEDGQACGPALRAEDFVTPSTNGFRGWHEEDAWDVDSTTRAIVGAWIKTIREAKGL